MTYLPGSAVAGPAPATSIIQKEGQVFVARDALGVRFDSGQDARAVLQTALDAAPDGARIVVGPGTYPVSGPIVIRRRLAFHCHGVLRAEGPAGTAAVQLGDENQPVASDIEAYVAAVDGVDRAAGRVGIEIRNAVHTHLTVIRIVNCNTGLRLQQRTAAARLGENTVIFRRIQNCTRGVFFAAPPIGVGAANNEGCELWGGSILNCDLGIEFEPGQIAGGTMITGTIDNAANPGSRDYVNNMGQQLSNVLLLKFMRAEASEFGPRDIVINPQGPNLRFGDVLLEQDGTSLGLRQPIVIRPGTASAISIRPTDFAAARVLLDWTMEGDPHPRVLVVAEDGKVGFRVGDGAEPPVQGLALSATGILIVPRGLSIGNAKSATATGQVVRKIEIFDPNGVSMGFIPVYASIT